MLRKKPFITLKIPYNKILTLRQISTIACHTPPEDSDNVLTAKDMKIIVMKESELLHYLGELE